MKKVQIIILGTHGTHRTHGTKFEDNRNYDEITNNKILSVPILVLKIKQEVSQRL